MKRISVMVALVSAMFLGSVIAPVFAQAPAPAPAAPAGEKAPAKKVKKAKKAKKMEAGEKK